MYVCMYVCVFAYFFFIHFVLYYIVFKKNQGLLIELLMHHLSHCNK